MNHEPKYKVNELIKIKPYETDEIREYKIYSIEALTHEDGSRYYKYIAGESEEGQEPFMMLSENEIFKGVDSA